METLKPPGESLANGRIMEDIGWIMENIGNIGWIMEILGGSWKHWVDHEKHWVDHGKHWVDRGKHWVDHGSC
ncbi:23169_t:CDS:2 [Dentiscutata erythropus]|uniref:23169_t:CDS:1 n=1 Tax=Dentiscutata erythropus TaxID=1348616 RepID=A0A9N9GQ32_9GLOM|nr:23169_t:CDS:2 [Dentiscutata erythropus]